MGREIKRVPLDFDWPLEKVWKGYVDPFYKRCPEEGKTCFDGYTAAGKWLESIIQFMMLVGSDGALGKRGVGQWPHPYLQQFPQAPSQLLRSDHYYGEIPINPTKEFGELTQALAGRPLRDFGHDSIDTYEASKKILEAAGLNPKTWGICSVCDGHNTDPATRKQSEAWKRTEPPAGEGWQVWETVSEGSPVSPVFKTSDELVDYLVNQSGVSREAAEKFVTCGWVPSMVVSGGNAYKGIESAVLANKSGGTE